MVFSTSLWKAAVVAVAALKLAQYVLVIFGESFRPKYQIGWALARRSDGLRCRNPLRCKRL